MIFSSKQNKAIRGCLNQGIPFAVWRKPNSAEICFCANPLLDTSSSEPVFSINLWNSDTLVSLHNELNVEQTLQYLEQNEDKRHDLSAIECKATDKSDYLSKVGDLIKTLKTRGGKTVISRTTVGSSEKVDWCKVAEQYFEKFGGAFAYLYYTPQTGAWLGASPELLLSHDKSSNVVSTMSLAGTRNVRPTNESWDEKNIKEQQLVTDFIIEVLQKAELTVNVGSVETLNYGMIEHLCTRISATKNDEVSFMDLANNLSPTPALAGYPRAEALAEIEQIESHQRKCYGGYICIAEQTKTEAYVNLRCVTFDNTHWCIFSGGGITADSDAISEWQETEAKASALLSLIKQF